MGGKEERDFAICNLLLGKGEKLHGRESRTYLKAANDDSLRGSLLILATLVIIPEV